MTKRPPPTRRTPTWDAPPDLVELMGPVSGNDLNGLGEDDVRRPTVVMWSWTEPFQHRPMQDLISRRHIEHPELRNVLRYGDRDAYEPPSVAPTREHRSPDAWVQALRDAALGHPEFPVDDVGVARVRPEWVYEGHDVDETWAILLAVEMEHEELATAPSWQAGAEVQRQYNRGTYAARALADWLGVDHEWAYVRAATRISTLAEGGADVVVATMGHNTRRDAQARFIRPHYYRSQTIVVGPKASEVGGFEDLYGRSVCTTIGNYANSNIVSHYVA